MTTGLPQGLVYRRLAPPGGAEHVVEHLWLVRAPAPSGPRREVLIPNGRPTVAVPLAEVGTRIGIDGSRRPNDGLLSGVSAEPVVIEQRGASWYVGAQLTPSGTGWLTGGDLLVDSVASVDGTLGEPGLVARLRRLADDGDRTRAGEDLAVELGQAIARRLERAQAARASGAVPHERRRAIDRAVAVCDAHRGDVGTEAMAAAAAVSPSTLRRWFAAHVGVRPKVLAGITRFYHFVGDLVGPGGPDTVAMVAALRGYADASHAASEVRRYAGISPAELRRRQHGIAALMHGPG